MSGRVTTIAASPRPPLAVEPPAPIPRPSRGRRLAAFLDPRGSAGRFRSLDGFRALAALAVLVYHVAGYSGLTTGASPVAGVLHNLGNFAVATFFLLSGFLLYRPFVAAAFADRPPPDPVLFLRRRVVRIFPAYVVALGAWILLGLNTVKGATPDYYVTLFTLTQVYRKAYGFAGLSVAWTLCIELSFYIALPFLAAGIRALGRGATSLRGRLEAQLLGLATIAGVTLVFRYFVAAPAQYDNKAYPFAVYHLWLPNYFDWFALGMLLAVGIAWTDAGRHLPSRVTWLAERGWLCWAVSAALYATLVLIRDAGPDSAAGLVRETPPQMFARFLLNGLAAFFFLLPAVFAAERPSLINRALSNVVLLYLGTVSFGIYLWHKIWLDKLKIGHELAPHRIAFPVMLGAVLVLAVAVSSVSYFLLERPLMKYKDPRRLREPHRSAPR